LQLITTIIRAIAVSGIDINAAIWMAITSIGIIVGNGREVYSVGIQNPSNIVHWMGSQLI